MENDRNIDQKHQRSVWPGVECEYIIYIMLHTVTDLDALEC